MVKQEPTEAGSWKPQSAACDGNALMEVWVCLDCMGGFFKYLILVSFIPSLSFPSVGGLEFGTLSDVDGERKKTWMARVGRSEQNVVIACALRPRNVLVLLPAFFDMPYGITSRNIHGGTFNDVGRDQTNNTYRGQVIGHHVQIETMTVGCSHSQQLVKRTMYDEVKVFRLLESLSLLTSAFQFEYIKLGQIIPLETLSTEDLSKFELSYRSGRMVGRLKTHVTTCTVTIGHDKDSKLVAMMYEGEDAQKAWEHDFQYISGIK
ncbi:hypothetical protein VNI00_016049 [Paramarasmius palmivorus]|uniref:Uncharacterized protein n=1 Tax=Paramarasmius palmivorus TaxID=297713 RepID=A0AAW0BGJ9_9AGAR